MKGGREGKGRGRGGGRGGGREGDRFFKIRFSVPRGGGGKGL